MIDFSFNKKEILNYLHEERYHFRHSDLSCCCLTPSNSRRKQERWILTVEKKVWGSLVAWGRSLSTAYLWEQSWGNWEAQFGCESNIQKRSQSIHHIYWVRICRQILEFTPKHLICKSKRKQTTFSVERPIGGCGLDNLRESVSS